MVVLKPVVKERSMKNCFLFPGQGAQYPGMGKDLYESDSTVRYLFQLASDTTKINMEKLLFEGTEAELAQTDKTQVAITLINLAVRAVLLNRGIEAAASAGFSLGEFAALVEAGVLSTEEVFPLVALRGRAMQEASRTHDGPEGPTGMAAVIGATFEELSAILEPLSEVYIANYNAPTQLVISGTARGLAAAETACKEKGVRRVIRLKVSGPFHCPLLEEARVKFAEAAKKCSFKNPIKPVFSNVTGTIITTGEEARELSIKQIVSPVLWVKEEEAIAAAGYDRCLETGPGKVLSGVWKSAGHTLPCLNVGTKPEIDSLPN